jgi:hypothetical protein
MVASDLKKRKVSLKKTYKKELYEVVGANTFKIE